MAQPGRRVRVRAHPDQYPPFRLARCRVRRPRRAAGVLRAIEMARDTAAYETAPAVLSRQMEAGSSTNVTRADESLALLCPLRVVAAGGDSLVDRDPDRGLWELPSRISASRRAPSGSLNRHLWLAERTKRSSPRIATGSVVIAAIRAGQELGSCLDPQPGESHAGNAV